MTAQQFPTMRELIDRCGEWLGARKCSLCEGKKLYSLRYGEGENDRFIVCQKCDTDKG